MFRSVLRPASRIASPLSARYFSVAVLGAGGGIGQPLSALLKLSQRVSKLSLYDIRGAPGVAADLSHINTPAEVKGFGPDDDGLHKALEGTDLIIIPAGVPRKPGMTRDDLFSVNASIVRDLAKAAAKSAPNALVGIISNPVNSTVPIWTETYKKLGVHDPKKIFGVTTLDAVRASTFIAPKIGATEELPGVTVVGGHSGTTIVPLFSQVAGAEAFVKSGQDYKDLVHRVQFGGDEVVKAKDGAGSATLSMAYSGALFADALIVGATQHPTVVAAFVESPLYADKGVPFFASKLTVGPEGVQQIHPVGPITPEEEALLDEALPALKTNIDKGLKFIDEQF